MAFKNPNALADQLVKPNINKQSFSALLKKAKTDFPDDWTDRMDYIRQEVGDNFKIDEDIADLELEGDDVYGIKTFLEGEPKRVKLHSFTPSLRDRFNRYINEGIGSGEDIDYWNDEIIDIEKQLPFKDEDEHKKWSDQAAAWKGEPEWLDLTNEILGRIK